MDNTPPALSYRRAADQVMFFGGILTLIFGFFAIVVTLVLETAGHSNFAERWVVLSGCSMVTAFLFTIGIALAFGAEGPEHVHRQQDIFLSEKV